MPSTFAALGLACESGYTLQSTHSEEDLLCTESAENLDQGDSPDEDCGVSDFDSESDDDHKEVINKETAVQDKSCLSVKNGGIGGACSADSDDTFRARLDLELKKYKEAKTRFLLSLIHDNKSSKAEEDENCLDKVYALFGDEVIILRDLNDNVDNKIKIGTCKDKKGRRDRNQRVKSRSRTSSRESTLDVPSESDRRRLQSEDDHTLIDQGEETVSAVKTNAADGAALLDKPLLPQDGQETTIERFQFEEHFSPEQEAERERRAKLRKMYRWERYRFGRFLEAKSLEHDQTDIHPSMEDLTTPTPLLGTQISFGIPHKHSTTLQERRDKIGDSLFKGEYRTNVCYIDSKDAGMDQPVLPIITASNYQNVFSSKPQIDNSKLGNPLIGASDKVKSETAIIKEMPSSTVVEVVSEVEAEEGIKKGKKDSKKKKKRRSSSSSDDLEELERKSEARLGKRK